MNGDASDEAGVGAYTTGTVLAGRYRIVSLLGRGGMGEVYRADDLVLGEQVALKFLPVEAAAQPEYAERFLGEVRIARQVGHPNVARVHDIGEADGRPFLSMEYVDGEDLSVLLKRIGRLPAEKAVEIARQICEGLHAIHERGILHRDLKPANVMLDGQGRVRLTDFGLAGFATRGPQDRIAGTPAYMSPEHITGDEVTVRSDVYSLGLVLYEVFTGRRAFEAKSVAEFTRMHQEEPPPTPSSSVETIDPAVESVILRCLEKEPAERPVSARAVGHALPGGDPLAAALAAGATPAPELVAAAGSTGGLSPRVATGLYVGFLIVLVAGSFLAPLIGGPGNDVRLGKSPQVLLDQARRLIERLGFDERPVDSGFAYRQVGRGADAPLIFHYRQSPEPLVPGQRFLTPSDPAPTRPGMIALTLDVDGRLIEFSAVPRTLEEGTGERTVDESVWTGLMEAAGYSADAAHEVEPRLVVPYAVERRAWTVPMESGGVAVLDAGGAGGRPVFFRRSPPGGRDAPPDQFVALYFVMATFLIGSVMAWRNVRDGRGDRRGAVRLGVFVIAAHLIHYLAVGHVPATADGALAGLVGGAMYSTWVALLVAVFYLAIEPFVRRHWPRCLISWQRVLSGRLNDPTVGRDVLAGCAWTALQAALWVGYMMGAEALGYPLPAGRHPDHVRSLAGVGDALGVSIHAAGDAPIFAFMFLLLLVFLRVVLRQPVLAGLAWLAAMGTLAFGWIALAGLPFMLVGFAVMLFLFARFGVLAVSTSWCLTTLSGVLHVGTETSSWAFHETLIYLAISLGLATWAWRATLAGRPAFADAQR
ncbi:MAG: protein kinase domain-containing protein [Planctomycetota bacterium]